MSKAEEQKRALAEKMEKQEQLKREKEEQKKRLEEKALLHSATEALNAQKPITKEEKLSNVIALPNQADDKVTNSTTNAQEEEEKLEQEQNLKVDSNKRKEQETQEQIVDKSTDQDGVIDSTVSNLLSMFTTKKLTMEQTHKRETFLIRRDLVDAYNELLEELGEDSKGKKTEWINAVIEEAVQKLRETKNAKDLLIKKANKRSRK